MWSGVYDIIQLTHQPEKNESPVVGVYKLWARDVSPTSKITQLLYHWQPQQSKLEEGKSVARGYLLDDCWRLHSQLPNKTLIIYQGYTLPPGKTWLRPTFHKQDHVTTVSIPDEEDICHAVRFTVPFNYHNRTLILTLLYKHTVVIHLTLYCMWK